MLEAPTSQIESKIEKKPYVLSYRGLRKAVGLIAVSLPFVLVIGKWIRIGAIIHSTPGLQRSISAYYYTDMRNIFIGSLCAISVFLLATWGYNRADAIAGRFAAIFAFGVAWFPTSPDPPLIPSHAQLLIGRVHIAFAASLFLILAFFCIFQFTQSHSPRSRRTPQKRTRNVVFYLCGVTILACIVACPVADHFKHPIFWYESLAVITFGIAWLVKGEMLLSDQVPQKRRPDGPDGPNWNNGDSAAPHAIPPPLER